MNDEPANPLAPLALLATLEIALALVQAEILTPDELRAMIGLGPRPA